MKFGGSITINQPRDKVVDLFTNVKHLDKWQEGFIKKELISGKQDEAGAVSKIYFKQGKRDMVLTETITANDLPNSIQADYHHQHMDNSLKTSFSEVDSDITKFTMEGEYTAFRGLIPKLMAALFPKLFSKQAQKWMNNFKAFAEKQ